MFCGVLWCSVGPVLDEMTNLSLYFISWLIAISSVASQEGPVPKIEVGKPQYAARSGTAQFTVVKSHAMVSDIPVRCVWYGFIVANTSILRDGEVMPTAVLSGGRNELVGTYRHKSNVSQEFSCLLHISSGIRVIPSFSYNIESIVEVIMGDRLHCLSDAGDHGVFGEIIKLRCDGVRGSLGWKSTRRSYIKRLLETDGFSKSEACINFKQSNDVCQSPKIKVLPSIQVEISPVNFTSEMKVLEFNCTSYPPRLMYWSIVSSHGDLLSYNNLKYNNATLVNTSILILQSAGWTSLRITEATAGGNDIKRVVCYTYNTNVKQATSLLVTDGCNPHALAIALLMVLVLFLLIIVGLGCFIIWSKFFRGKPTEVAHDVTTGAYSTTLYTMNVNQTYEEVG